MSNHLSSRLAARAIGRQTESIILAERAAMAVDRAVIGLWRRILFSINQRNPAIARHQVQGHLASLAHVAKASVRDSLTRVAHWGRRAAMQEMGILPSTYLRAATVARVAPSPTLESTLLEIDAHTLIMRGISNITTGPAVKPGIIELALQALGLPTDPFSASNFIFGPREEPTAETMTPQEKREAYSAFLFPPPAAEDVHRIVHATVGGVTWEQRLDSATRTSATPEKLAQIVGDGVAAGRTAQQIAKELLPVVDGVRSSARRIARTESLRVVHEVQFEQWQGLGEMIAGYQIHSVMDERVRSSHALRNGHIYYVNPKPGQSGLDECPHPPAEADGTVAQNCRCYLSVVLHPADYIEESPSLKAVFTNAASEVIPDPTDYRDWFSRVDEPRRRLAVGARRYAVVKERVGENPQWAAFIDPSTGSLMPMRTLADETSAQRSERIGEVNEAVARRAEMLRTVLTYGTA
jgi:SPP1 gp7 family putative phage head morphogenesis protein